MALRPALERLTDGLSPDACSAFQVYSNLLYVAAGVLGVSVGTAPPLNLARSGRIAARVTMTLVGIILVLTGMVSTWYHRVGTSATCCHSTYKKVGQIDIGCATTTSAVGIAVLFPLTVVGLARCPRAGPAVLLVLAVGIGAAAVALHVQVTRSQTRSRRPCAYDLAHGTWHALGAMSAALAFCAAFMALRPAQPYLRGRWRTRVTMPATRAKLPKPSATI
jgi:hypothetical protein